MKKIIISILIFLFAFGFSAQAAAIDLPDVTLTPDSPFYFVKAWKESIQTFFTFGLENKAKQYLHLAEVRLAEYQKMVEKGKTEIAQKTLEKYEKQLNHALDKAKELQDKGKDIKNLSGKIEQSVSKHLGVLQENLQKVPEQAKKGIENAIENSRKGLDKILQKQNPITVISPNGGETWEKGEKVRILWSAVDEIKNVNIRLAISGEAEGQSFNAAIASDASNTGSYEWVVQDLYSEVWGANTLPASDKYILAIEDSEHSNVFDSSNEPFTISLADETQNWQTYRNEEYGFEVKYPKEWSEKEKELKWSDFYSSYPELKNIDPLLEMKFVSSDNSEKTLGITVYKNNPRYTLKQWLVKFSESTPTELGLGWRENITVNNVSGIKGALGCCMVFHRSFFFTEEDKIFQMEGGVINLQTGLSDYEELFNQFLSTFKFIE